MTDKIEATLENMNRVSKKSASDLQDIALDAVKIIGHLCTEYNLPVDGAALQNALIDRMRRSHEEAISALKGGQQ